MDRQPESVFHNPYASPAAVPDAPSAPVEPAATRNGALAIIIPGFVLLLAGYMTSNLFAIGDLYGMGFGPAEKPSPFGEIFTTPLGQWLFYAVTSGAAIAGCVLLGSQNSNPMAVVCFVMCPIAGLVFLVGMPLRLAVRWATPIATIYLAVGTCLAGAGIIRLVNFYGAADLTVEPFVASLMTQAGLALVAGGVLKLWTSGALSASESSAGHGDLAAAR